MAKHICRKYPGTLAAELQLAETTTQPKTVAVTSDTPVRRPRLIRACKGSYQYDRSESLNKDHKDRYLPSPRSFLSRQRGERGQPEETEATAPAPLRQGGTLVAVDRLRSMTRTNCGASQTPSDSVQTAVLARGRKTSVAVWEGKLCDIARRSPLISLN